MSPDSHEKLPEGKPGCSYSLLKDSRGPHTATLPIPGCFDVGRTTMNLKQPHHHPDPRAMLPAYRKQSTSLLAQPQPDKNLKDTKETMCVSRKLNSSAKEDNNVSTVSKSLLRHSTRNIKNKSSCNTIETKKNNGDTFNIRVNTGVDDKNVIKVFSDNCNQEKLHHKETLIQLDVMCDLPVTTPTTDVLSSILEVGGPSDTNDDNHHNLKELDAPIHNTADGAGISGSNMDTNIFTSMMKACSIPVIVNVTSADSSPRALFPKICGSDVSLNGGSERKFPPPLGRNGKIGRPRKSEVVLLQAEGESSSSEMKCLVCKRVFPRLKSLEAHMRIHTGCAMLKCVTFCLYMQICQVLSKNSS